ncbi:pyridoxal phosphate-dependent aminotransferase [soil metagenome]
MSIDSFAAPPSRLPKVGTTIFTTMSALATERGAINLGQGFPDFACDPKLLDAVTASMQRDQNQYAPMTGVAPLRDSIAAKLASMYGGHYDAGTEITVTAGATQALLTAILCAVHPGDEVIIIEPVYDSYVPGIELSGGTAVPVPMIRDGERFRIDWLGVSIAVTPRTRMIIVNSPHNPTCFVMDAADLDALTEIVSGTDIVVLSDEVYEHMVFDGKPHLSLAGRPALRERSFVVSSFGKSLHVTGWKIGYCAAPAALTAEFRKVHQFNVFAVNTPMQFGIADYLADPAPLLALPAFYQRKRDRFRAGLASTRLRLLQCAGTYFQTVDYQELKGEVASLDEEAACRWLTSEIGVAAIPLSAFYGKPTEHGLVRLCFAKQDSTLDAALARLARL